MYLKTAVLNIFLWVLARISLKSFIAGIVRSMTILEPARERRQKGRILIFALQVTKYLCPFYTNRFVKYLYLLNSLLLPVTWKTSPTGSAQDQPSSPARPSLPSSPSSSAAGSSSSTSTWLIGGDGGLARSVEAISSSNGKLCSRTLNPLPLGKASMMGGFVGGQVLACGGSSPERAQTSVYNDCIATSSDRSGRWQQVGSMPHNTSNAGHAVANNGKLYVAGGYTQPLCGYRPEVQVYSPRSGWSAPSSLDPPNRVGAYSCAVAAGKYVFFIGGWYPPSVYTSACREDRYEGAELTRVNREFEYYHNQVQVLDTSTGRWRIGPKLETRRRNHGCTLTEVNGRAGIIVAGGDNPRDGGLSSVEYLDLGPDLSGIQFRDLQWRNLPNMSRGRTGRLVLYADKNSVYAVGEDGVEALDLTRPVWKRVSSSVAGGRSHSLAVANVPGAVSC